MLILKNDSITTVICMRSASLNMVEETGKYMTD